MSYDVIVVGARVGGAPTAMLLARQGLNVLLVDRAAFPSDTLSTHQIQLPGVARLARWGLLDRVAASNAPATRAVRFDAGTVVLEGRFPEHEGIDAMYSPRRTVLDSILVDAAREAGAEVREQFIVDDLVWRDGRVAGVRCHARRSAPVEETAAIVVGADGKHSEIAAAVAAPEYRRMPALSMGYYTYWEGVPVHGGEIGSRPGRAVGAWPTNDGLLITYVAWPAREFHVFRSDIERHFLATLDLFGDLGARVRSGARVERFFGSADLPNVFRKPHGPGWALVGDAGLVMDPITGQGISDAFRDAELLSTAIATGLGGARSLEKTLREYERARDRAVGPMYAFTTELASFPPPRAEDRLLFEALAGDRAQTSRFFGVLTGAVPIREFFSPVNLVGLVGLRGFARMALGRARGSHGSDSPPREGLARAA